MTFFIYIYLLLRFLIPSNYTTKKNLDNNNINSSFSHGRHRHKFNSVKTLNFKRNYASKRKASEELVNAISQRPRVNIKGELENYLKVIENVKNHNTTVRRESSILQRIINTYDNPTADQVAYANECRRSYFSKVHSKFIDPQKCYIPKERWLALRDHLESKKENIKMAYDYSWEKRQVFCDKYGLSSNIGLNKSPKYPENLTRVEQLKWDEARSCRKEILERLDLFKSKNKVEPWTAPASPQPAPTTSLTDESSFPYAFCGPQPPAGARVNPTPCISDVVDSFFYDPTDTYRQVAETLWELYNIVC